MDLLRSVNDVLALIQHAKAGASDFRTNFFPVERRLQAWIDHGEIAGERRGDSAFFVRADRGFWHLLFCVPQLSELEAELRQLPILTKEAVVVDLVGAPEALAATAEAFEAVGFRHYHRLCRLVRIQGSSTSTSEGMSPGVEFASPSDGPGVLRLLEEAFDVYAEQLPSSHEVESSIAARQILVVRKGPDLAALLFFESQGLSTTLRFWVVAERYRALRLGSALMRHYFALHRHARRFVLWVATANVEAIDKYKHYGYTPDTLVDQILVNELVPYETAR